MVQTAPQPPRARGEPPQAPLAQEVRVVTESTSKGLKVHLLWAYAVFALGVAVAAGGSMVAAKVSQDYFATEAVLMVGLAVCCLAIVWVGVTKARIWWHHE